MIGLFSGMGSGNPVGGLASLLGGGTGLTGILDKTLLSQMMEDDGKSNLLGQLLQGGTMGAQSLIPIFARETGMVPMMSSGLAEDMLMPSIVPAFNQGTML